MREIQGRVHLKTELFPNCEPVNPNKLYASKYSGGTVIDTIGIPVPKKRNQREKQVTGLKQI